MNLPPYHWWRTVFFLIPAIGCYTIVLGALSIASSLVDRRGTLAHRCARLWSRLILRTTGVRVRVQGLERLTAGATYLFVSNHQSIYDIPVLFASLPYQVRIIAKASLARFPVLGWHLRRGGHLFVDRRHPDRAGILRQWRALIGDGLSLIIFPEGTRSWDGRVARFKAGSFLLAIEAGLPVVPIAVIGTRAVMPKGRLRTEPADVTVIVHEPVQPPAPDGPAVVRAIDAARALAARAQRMVAEALERGGNPARPVREERGGNPARPVREERGGNPARPVREERVGTEHSHTGRDQREQREMDRKEREQREMERGQQEGPNGQV